MRPWGHMLGRFGHHFCTCFEMLLIVCVFLQACFLEGFWDPPWTAPCGSHTVDSISKRGFPFWGKVWFGIGFGSLCDTILKHVCDSGSTKTSQYVLGKCKGKQRTLDEKRYPKMRSKKEYVCWFVVFFWGLGPKVSQGGTRNPPRQRPVSNLLQNGFNMLQKHINMLSGGFLKALLKDTTKTK